MNAEEILKQYWGFDSFRSIQKDIILSVLDSKDTLGIMPTGGGKSICFQVPAMMKPGFCLVISPLIALIKDQVQQLKNRGIAAEGLTMGMTSREINLALENCHSGQIKFLYISPERLLSEKILERLPHYNINLLAVDEAHCISQWGYDFRPAYLQIANFRKIKPNVPILALTASANLNTENDIQEKLEFTSKNVLKSSFARSNLSFSVFDENNKMLRILKIVNQVKGSGIIYVGSRKESQKIAEELNFNKISAAFYHAGMGLNERTKVQNLWMNNKVRIIVATNAFGMGIDKPDVRTVIHYHTPWHLSSYYQEAGRAGRDGKIAFGVVLYNQNDIKNLKEVPEKEIPESQVILHIYKCLTSFCQIYLAETDQLYKDFDIVLFCQKYNLGPSLVSKALKALSQLGALEFLDSYYSPHKFIFALDYTEVYKYCISNKRWEPLIKALLRQAGGQAFHEYYNLDIPQLTRALQLDINQTVTLLIELNKLNIIYFQKEKNIPQISFFSFLETKINVKTIESLRNKYEIETQKSIHFYTQQFRCRSIEIQDYFGEKTDFKCGKCDICIANKKKEQIKMLSDEKVKKLQETLKANPTLPKDLVLLFEVKDEELILNEIKYLLEMGTIKTSEHGLLVWK